MGGLTASNYLVQNSNHEIKLFEKNRGPGGRIHTLNIDGNNFDIGAVLIVPKLLQMLRKHGVVLEKTPFELDVISSKKRLPLRINLGRQNFADLKNITGHEFFQLTSVILKALKYLRTIRTFSVEDFLKTLEVPEVLQTYFNAMFTMWGVPPGRVEASVLPSSLMNLHHMVYPLGGTGQIPNRLLHRFLNNGGKFSNYHKVVQIEEDPLTVTLERTRLNDQIEVFPDKIISNLGIESTLNLIKDKSQRMKHVHKKIKQYESTLPMTALLYSYKRKPTNFKGRVPFIAYLPFNSSESLNQYMEQLWSGKNPLGGFYIHFSSLIDPKASTTGEYPILFYVYCSRNPTKKDINRFTAFVEEEFDKEFLPGFKDHSELLKVIDPQEYRNMFGDNGSITPIAPTINYPIFKPKLSEKILLAGCGTVLGPPSLLQAGISGNTCARQLLEELS